MTIQLSVTYTPLPLFADRRVGLPHSCRCCFPISSGVNASLTLGGGRDDLPLPFSPPLLSPPLPSPPLPTLPHPPPSPPLPLEVGPLNPARGFRIHG